MNPVRKRRLIAVCAILGGVSVATTLIFFALGENLNHFYTPTELSEGKAPVGQRIRVGGLVKDGSVERASDSLQVMFAVTDNARDVLVEYTGILPDLFREGQGIVANGRMGEGGVMIADEVLAKHDENYMPPEAMEAMKRAGHPMKPEQADKGQSTY